MKDSYKIPFILSFLLIGGSFVSAFNGIKFLLGSYVIKGLISLLFFFFFKNINLNYLKKYGLYIYVLQIIFLIMTYVIKSNAKTKRWLSFGGMFFQPSEFAKLSTIVIVSFILDRYFINTNIKIIVSIFMISIIFILIVSQPDLGTGIITIIPNIIQLIIFGINKILLTTGISLFGASIMIFFKYFIKEYQKKRIMGFIYPSKLNYQVNQSIISIGYGGIWGNLFNNTQINNGFLPASHTDFAFSTLCSFFGIIPVMIIIYILYLLINILFKYFTTMQHNIFVQYLLLGVIQYLIIGILFNLSVILHLIPVSGVPMPAISYGGSSLMCTLISLGIIQNIITKKNFY